MNADFLLEATCCRRWPVAYGLPIGKCGYCGERPTITGRWADVDR